MNLYKIEYGAGGLDYVEGPNLYLALSLWRQEQSRSGGSMNPDSIELVSTREVLRPATATPPVETHDPSTHRVLGVWCAKCSSNAAPAGAPGA